MEGVLIGRVFNFFEKVFVVAIELSDNLKLGESIRIVGSESDLTMIVDSMQIDGKFVESAKSGDRIGLKVAEKVSRGAKVYRV